MVRENGMVMMSESEFNARISVNRDQIKELEKRCEMLTDALLKLTAQRETAQGDVKIPKADFIKIYNDAVNYMFDHYDEDNDIYGYDVTIHWHGMYCNCGDGAAPSNHIVGGLECLYDEDPDEY